MSTYTKLQSLFSPVQIGLIHLRHRVVMAPLTRNSPEQPCDIPADKNGAR